MAFFRNYLVMHIHPLMWILVVGIDAEKVGVEFFLRYGIGGTSFLNEVPGVSVNVYTGSLIEFLCSSNFLITSSIFL